MFAFLVPIIESITGAFAVLLTFPAFGYLRLLAFFGVGPEILGFGVFHREVTRYARVILGVMVIAFFIGLIWDYVAIKDNVWYFVNYLNIWILGIPLEEYLFFIFFTFGIAATTVILKVHQQKYVWSR